MQEKDRILEALEFGNYQMRFEPVNSVDERTKYDGTNFYVFLDLDGPRSSTDMGTCTIEVNSDETCHEFIYDMNTGEWEGDELCNEEEIVEALESLDGFIPYDDYDFDRQWEVYAETYNIPIDASYYWCENNDYPKDIESLGDEEVELPVQYFISLPHGVCSEFMDMECSISDADLYNLYKLVDKELPAQDEEDAEPVDLSGSDIEDVYPELFKEIKEQVEGQAQNDGYQDENGVLEFTVLLTRDLFEENLAQFKSSVEIQSQLLAKYSTYTIQEEWNISYAVQLCSEAFYLRVQ